jgi:rhodanese-related sulfurtransferase
MNLRRYLIELVSLVVAALLLAVTANALAQSERRLALIGDYPNARVLPSRSAPPAPGLESRIIENWTGDDLVAEVAPLEGEGAPGPDGALPSAVAGAPPSSPAPPAATPRASREQILERFPPAPEVPSKEIRTAEAEWLWRHGALFLDARRTSVFHEGHIAGARSIAVWEADVDDKVKQLAMQGLDQELPIIIYCSGGDCEDSHMLAQKLWGMFFNNILVYHDGLPGWQQAGLPVRRGPQP